MKADINCKRILYAVLKDCELYIDSYYSTGIIAGIVFGLMYCLISLYLYDYTQQELREKMASVFFKCPFAFLLGFYCYLVLGITILSREKSNTSYIIRPIPFSTWGTDLWHLTLWTENILMMVPLGILLYILWAPFRKISWSVSAGFLLSLLIECIQLFTRLGKFEMDDIINNVIGTCIGFLICKGFSRAGAALMSGC